jgi:hypothetical protein
MQKSSVYGIEFCCEHAVNTMEAIEEHLALINAGTTSPTMEYGSVSVNCCIV